MERREERHAAACFILAAMLERQQVNRIWADQLGVWAFEASGLKPPVITSRQPKPAPVLAA